MQKENSTGFNLIRKWYEQGNSDTLGQYTTNSTLIFSESRIKDKFEIKREIIYEANLLLAQKLYRS
jgi:hypothetical protein